MGRIEVNLEIRGQFVGIVSPIYQAVNIVSYPPAQISIYSAFGMQISVVSRLIQEVER